MSGQKEEVKFLSPKEILIQRDLDKRKKVEAEIQKRLTKSSSYFSGQLVQKIGLRYAPEIRFYNDNTLELYKTFEDQRDKYMEEAKQEEEEKK